MKAPTWLLWLFPYTFARDFGEAWKSATEEMWRAGRSGGRNTLGLLFSLIGDCAKTAPRAHWTALKEAVLGPAPQMIAAGAGRFAIFKAWSGHVVHNERRNKQFTASFLFGIGLLILLNVLASRLSWSYVMGVASDLGDDNYVVKDATNYTLLALLFWTPVWLWMGNKFFRFFKDRKGPIVFNGVATFLGFSLALTILVLLSIPPVSKDAVDAFIRYPETQNLLTKRISENDPAQWTPEQLVWYDPATKTIRADKKDTWCGTRMGWSQAEHYRLTHGNPNDIVVPGLLWESELAFLVADGCLSTASYFQQINAFATRSMVPRGFETTKWMILSRISPVHDYLATAHFITWPRLHMNVAKACGGLVAEDRINGSISVDLNDETRVANMCVKLETTYGKKGSEPLGKLVGSIESDKLVPRWLRGGNLNTAIDDIAGTRVLSAQDFDFLREKIREEFDQDAAGAAKETGD